MIIPKITSNKTERIFILLVDIVGFSKLNDLKMQYAQFERLLEAFEKSINDLKNYPSDDAENVFKEGNTFSIMTGDGLLLAFRGITDPSIPYKIVEDLLQSLLGFKLRYAIHEGNVNWIDLKYHENQTILTNQIIGNTVNWTARILSLTTMDNEVLISTRYHNLVNPDLKKHSLFRGRTFVKVTGKTKHGEDIEAYRIE